VQPIATERAHCVIHIGEAFDQEPPSVDLLGEFLCSGIRPPPMVSILTEMVPMLTEEG
jgi:hypothetical protein